MNDTTTQEPSDSERWYDAEIAPVLANLAKQCGERGMGLLAAVEYEPGKFGSTHLRTPNDSLSMRMIYCAMAAAPNFDRFAFSFKRYCDQSGIDTSGSMVMAAMSRIGK